MNVSGFKVNFLGDSITEGVGVTDVAHGRYDNYVAKLLGLAAVNNYGASGTRLAHQTRPSGQPKYDLCFCGRAAYMDTTADMVVVYGGVNDYIHGDAPFGEMGDTMPNTFCGGVYFLMNYLRETYGDKPLVFLTPARCFYLRNIDDTVPSTHAMKYVPGKELQAYVDVIIQTAKQFGITVLDLYRNLGIDPHDPAHYEQYTIDGLHFNDAAHRRIAEKLKETIDAM